MNIYTCGKLQVISFIVHLLIQPFTCELIRQIARFAPYTGALSYFLLQLKLAGKEHDLTRHSAVTGPSEREKTAAGLPRARCCRRAFKKRTRRKVGVGCVRMSVQRGARSRPPVDATGAGVRGAAALRGAPPCGLLARAAVAARCAFPLAPHASHGRPRFPAARAATWPYLCSAWTPRAAAPQGVATYRPRPDHVSMPHPCY